MLNLEWYKVNPARPNSQAATADAAALLELLKVIGILRGSRFESHNYPLLLTLPQHKDFSVKQHVTAPPRPPQITRKPLRVVEHEPAQIASLTTNHAHVVTVKTATQVHAMHQHVRAKVNFRHDLN
jgi:hypothetical protein